MILDEHFKQALLSQISINKDDFSSLHQLLIAYKEAGMDETSMYNNLEALRSNCNADTEDIILDLMDFVTGFCNPSLSLF